MHVFCANSTKISHEFCELVWLTLNEFGSILSSTNEKQQKAVKNRRIKDMGGEKMICTVTFNPSLDYIVSV